MFGKSITPDSTVDYGAVYFQLCGYTMIGNGSGSGIRPTLYLDPSVYIIEGDGKYGYTVYNCNIVFIFIIENLIT